MYNSSSPASSSEHMNPRISFSNDFAESHHFHHQQQQVMRNQSSSSAASEFEFSVLSGGKNKSHSSMMTTADELFSKGQLLPLKPNSRTTSTLRDELLLDHEQLSLRPPKTSITRWKGFLGLNNKKSPPNNTSHSQQEMLSSSDGSGSSCRDVEIGR